MLQTASAGKQVAPPAPQQEQQRPSERGSNGRAMQAMGMATAPPSEAACAPTVAGIAATWLNPGFPQSTMDLTSDGTVVFNGRPAHGLAAVVPGGELCCAFTTTVATSASPCRTCCAALRLGMRP